MNREKRIESMESSLENVSKMERFREHCGKAKVMFVASVLLFVEIILLNCLIGKSLTGFLLPNWALGTCVFVIESALWVIILINFIASVSVIIRSTWNRAGCRASIFRHGRADSFNLKERELEYQMNLERSKKFEQKSHYFDVPHIIGLDWIGAIRSVPSRHAQLSSVSPDLSSVEESPYSLRDHLISSSPTGTKHSKSYITPRGDDPDLVLETKVGARVSPYNRAITSVQTSKQLDELLEAK
ncbi:hypothetical protein AB6A40_008313 [Gnathostoma spinigerum]|uniref:Uncharacterized protein n=1 Tax=Gnathostoma spinigerum TaxID=75299 RepID=A0ABD6EWG3_9BILA